MTHLRALFLATALIGVISARTVLAGGPDGIAFETGRVVIETDSGSHPIEVEIARTPEQRALGLMYRKHLPANHGMLFLYPGEGPVSMWMRNTYIPLDMLFIHSDGRIAAIEADTKPLSTELISAGTPVHAVLELPAGTAERLGIGTGDIVRYRASTPEKMAAPGQDTAGNTAR